jgi:hypothetical protein
MGKESLNQHIRTAYFSCLATKKVVHLECIK